MKNKEKRYLVYLSVCGKVFPQLWHSDQTNGNGKSKLSETLQYHLLKDEEFDYPLDALVKLYPYQKEI